MSQAVQLRLGYLVLLGMFACLLALVCFIILPGALAQTPSSLPPVLLTHRDRIPNFSYLPTIRSTRDGAYTDAATWEPARVPLATDVALVTHAVECAGQACTARTIGVTTGGTVSLASDERTRLTVGTLQVLPGGTLQIGTAEHPATQAELVIADTPLDLTDNDTGIYDPEQWGTGLLVLDGTLRLHGQPKTPFVRLSAALTAGQTVLPLASPVLGWQVGDRLVLPDTRQLHSGLTDTSRQWEERTLQAVASDGLSVTVTPPLAFAHAGAHNPITDTWHYAPLANLTRSVTIRSANPAGTRGHVAALHDADVQVAWVTFRDLGRTTTAKLNSTVLNDSHGVVTLGTNQVGRYPFHAHHLVGVPQANGYQFTVQGVVVDGGSAPTRSKWGLTFHNSHYGLIQDNIVYNVSGAGYMFEDGSETGNLVTENLALRITGIGKIDVNDGGMAGSGYWFRGPQNRVIGNIAVNAVSGFSPNFYRLGVLLAPKAPGMNPDHPGEGVLLNVGNLPLAEWRGNECISTYTHCLDLWELGGVGDFLGDPPLSTIHDTLAWHVARFNFFEYRSSRLLVDGLTCLGDTAQLAKGTRAVCMGYDSQYPTRYMRVQRLTSTGLTIGIDPPGFMVPDHLENLQIFQMLLSPAGADELRRLGEGKPGTLQVTNADLRNFRNIEITTPRRDTFTRQITLTNVRMGRTVAAPAGLGAPGDIVLRVAKPSGVETANLRALDQVYVRDYNGVVGDHFQAYYLESAPDAVMPMTAQSVIGAPVAGLTNMQAWAQYGIAVGGQITPCATRRDGVTGFVCPLSEEP